mmetsp:Transcript_79557/g.200088  ORF Transcript_79557/g.200088 Transcript_79557/m.200088 type:complete len:699 (+) Transcript_79557:119-2215(+)
MLSPFSRTPLLLILLPLVLLFAAMLTAEAASLDGAAAVTPTMKVIEMLSSMKAKGEEERHQEQVSFAEFSEFCRGTTEDKKRLIKEAATKITQLEATIALAESDAESLAEDISKLDSDIARWAAEEAKATELRAQERTDFEATSTDYAESIDALERAIRTLKARALNVPQATAKPTKEEVKAPSLLEVPGDLPPLVRRGLTALLDDPSQPHAYEFQSSSVVETLEKLRLQFQDEKGKLDKEEMNRKHAFQLFLERWHDDTRHAEDARAQRVATRASRLAKAADAKGDLAEVQAAKKADEQYLTDLTAHCDLKSHEFEERQNLRDGELVAIQKAIEIISSPEVAGVAAAHLPSAAAALAQQRPLALLQLFGNAGQGPVGAVRARLVAFLEDHAHRMDSGLLAMLAGHAAADPFEKVKQMLKDLIVRLMDEAMAEADHKTWCDNELAANKRSRDSLSEEVEGLSTKKEELEVLEAKLTEEISDLTEAIAELDAAVAKATEERQKDEAENKATIADASAAHASVTEAIEILRAFYAQAGEAMSLLQQMDAGRQSPVEEDSPSTWSSRYQGMQGESKGVFGLLEVVQSDFSRLEAEATVAEQEAAQKYKILMQDSAVDRSSKTTELRNKGYKLEDTKRILHETKKELLDSQIQLNDTLAYYEKLRPSCVDLGLSYEDRVKRREEEIQSLKEALRILGGEALP